MVRNTFFIAPVYSIAQIIFIFFCILSYTHIYAYCYTSKILFFLTEHMTWTAHFWLDPNCTLLPSTHMCSVNKVKSNLNMYKIVMKKYIYFQKSISHRIYFVESLNAWKHNVFIKLWFCMLRISVVPIKAERKWIFSWKYIFHQLQL